MKFEGVKISDLKAGEVINGIYLLKSVELKISSNKKTYLDIVFADSTGSIQAKWWDAGEAELNILLPCKLYYVNAKVDQWKEILQLTLNRVKIADDEDQKLIGDFVPAAPVPPEEMLQEVYSYAAKIKNA